MAASDAEMRLLGELRAKELKDLSPADFAVVEQNVKASGFKNLKGSSAQLVFNAIRKRDKALKDMKKHGNHDQSSHGSWANGATGMSALQETNMNAATDTLVNAYRDNNTGRVGVQASLGQAVKHHNMAVEAVKSGNISEASKHSLDAMKSFMAAADDAQGIDKKVFESSAQRYSEYMTRALDAKTVEKHGEHDQSSHGSWSGNPSNGDDPAAMDMMNDKPYKTPKLTAAQRKLYNRIASPASAAYVERPFGGVEFARSWGRKPGEPSVSGYVPFSGPENV